MTQLPKVPKAGSETDHEDRKQARSSARYAGVGLQFAIAVVLFLYVGQWVDRRLGTAPIGLILGVFLGAGASFWSMYHRLMKDLRDEEARRRK
ncbi:MAG: AtpZ/AtpI family protein [Gemmatimonadota bacterium]